MDYSPRGHKQLDGMHTISQAVYNDVSQKDVYAM